MGMRYSAQGVVTGVTTAKARGHPIAVARGRRLQSHSSA